MKAGSVFLVVLAVLFSSSGLAQDQKRYKIQSVAFYNLENLFDTKDDPLIFDDERTPKGKDHWTLELYQAKVRNMAKVISSLGKEQVQHPPVLVGLCELENLQVLEDLVKDSFLLKHNYGIVHFDSPDRRGIDVALLYQPRFFVPKHAVSHELILHDREQPQKRIYTRDQLVVSGSLEGEEIHIIVNHWPSRSGGVSASSYKRELAAKLNRKIIDSLQGLNPYAKVIVMGDFNDDPVDRSISEVLGALEEQDSLDFQDLFNPMGELFKRGIGSLAYRDTWNLFDQIMFTQPFLDEDYTGYQFFKARIYNKKFLVTPKGQYKGYPFRSFGSGGYLGGYSDHFPVYAFLIKEVPE